jgi:predicted DNA-binding transcriptional regulator AlpA
MRQLVTLRDKFPGVHRSTRYRWRKDPRLNFPRPVKTIHNVEYFDDAELDNWKPPPRQQHEAPAEKFDQSA